MSAPGPAAAEARTLRAATRRLALLTAAAVTAVLLVVGGVVAGVVLQEQRGEAHKVLEDAVVDLDDLNRAPSPVSIWVLEPDGTQRRSPGAPRWLPVQQALSTVTVDAARDERTVQRAGATFDVLTIARDGRIIQAVTPGGRQAEERDRLIVGLIVAELLGLLLSLALGGYLARRAMGPLVASMARQRRFVADASHELRTPLTLLSTRAQLLERRLRTHSDSGADTNAGAHAESQALVDDARRLAGVVDDLLLSASMTEQDAHREPIDLVALCRTAAAGATSYAAEHGVSLQGPGDDQERAMVAGHPGPLRRVLDALVDNAVTHSRTGSRVVIDVRPGSPHVVRVIDNGSGIDPGIAPRLFDRFAHGTSSGPRRHYGLGLALVREVVSAHGGTVRADPTPGGGATFTVTFPRSSPVE